ncbi:hypothetical protein KY338_03830 [Candidatus Woesearchaeota archaeon]|nr:hypothetical protein [Candidatus Woesearchaeota archaeon]MBW3005442.1 hypothetical protein [Candidatus Woesearchaeota archaeon]
METAKLNRILFGGIFSALALGFLIIILSLVLSGRIDLPWYGSIGVLLMVLVFLEVGLYFTKKSAGIKEEKIKTEYIATWSDIAGAILGLGTIQLIIMGLISAGFIAFAVYIAVSQFMQYPFRADLFGYFIIIAVIGYFIFRSFILGLFQPMARVVKSMQRKIMPFYEVFVDKVVIDPAITGSKAKFVLKFSELSEIREMSFFEAEAYKENIGPNVPLGIEQTKSLYKLAKSGERPKVYFMAQSNGKTVLFKGNNIHYLITFGVDSAKDLIDAFKKYKKK